MKTSKWVDNFRLLEPEQQLEIANAVIEELELNEDVINEDIEDDTYDEEDEKYDMSKSETLRKLFLAFINMTNNSEKLNKYKEILNKYDSLGDEYKEKVLDRFGDIITNEYDNQTHDINAAICLKEGHVFGEWKYAPWTEYGPGMIDHQSIERMEYTHERWICTCGRCGFVKKVTEEPEEAKKAREEELRKVRIKSLERERIETIRRIDKELQELKRD